MAAARRRRCGLLVWPLSHQGYRSFGKDRALLCNDGPVSARSVKGEMAIGSANPSSRIVCVSVPRSGGAEATKIAASPGRARRGPNRRQRHGGLRTFGTRLLKQSSQSSCKTRFDAPEPCGRRGCRSVTFRSLRIPKETAHPRQPAEDTVHIPDASRSCLHGRSDLARKLFAFRGVGAVRGERGPDYHCSMR